MSVLVQKSMARIPGSPAFAVAGWKEREGGRAPELFIYANERAPAYVLPPRPRLLGADRKV